MTRPGNLTQLTPRLLRVLMEFLPEVKRHRGLVGVSVLALFAQVGFRILEPWPLKFVFDRVLTVGATPGRSGIPILDSLDATTLLVVASAAIVVISGCRALATYWSKIGFALVGQRVLARVRGRLFLHVQYLSLSFHTNARNGDLLVRLMGDVGMLREVVVTALLPLAAKTLILIGMVGLMFWFSWKLALIALLTTPLFWFPTVRLSRRIGDVARTQRRRRGTMASTAVESIGAISTVQALSLEDTFADAFSSQDKRSVKEGVKAKRLAARLQQTVAIVISTATALVVFFGARQVLAHQLTPGDLLVFLFYLKSAFRPVQDFAKYSARLAKATAAGERVLEILQKVPDIRDAPDAVPAARFEGRIRYEGVSFGYCEGQPVLDDVSLTIEPGQLVAVVGPSGGGKSTLVNLLPRLYDPDRGEIAIDGTPLRAVTVDSLRSQLGIVLQETLLFRATIGENIVGALSGVSDGDIERAARLAEAHDFIARLPEGYDTMVGEKGVTLSHGERQRIAIARAAIRRPSILILDEPVAGLDERNARLVVRAFERLARETTTVLITHELRFAEGADQILFLDRGRIRERGTHAELIEAGRAYAALYRQQMPSVDEGGADAAGLALM